MKKLLLILALFCTFGKESATAQSVRINFIRYKTIEFNNGKWEVWPLKWKSSSAYALVSSVYDATYKVSIYGNEDQLIATSICTFDSETTTKKREAQNLPYLNCYVDAEGNQIWTNIVSLESLLENVENWKMDDASLYLWIFGSSSSFAFSFE